MPKRIAGPLVVIAIVLVPILSRFHRSAAGGNPSAGEILSAYRLAEGESIGFAIRVAGFDTDLTRYFEISGGSPRLFSASSLWPPAASAATRGTVRDSESVGLDAYLHFLRMTDTRALDMRGEVIVGYYRDNQKIGEERFRDDTHFTQAMIPGSEVSDEPYPHDCPADFPEDIFRSIVTPVTIERRMNRPNKALEPTPTSVTSPAAQEPRQP